MSEQVNDRRTDQRLDDAIIIDFLTSTASVFAKHGITSSKDTDNLRLSLSGLASDPSGRTLLLALERERAEYLDLLKARFGTAGLSLNLLRFSMRPPLLGLIGVLSEVGQALLKKAELLFNRPFLLQLDGHPARQVLFSTVIVDLAAAIADTCQLISDNLGHLNQMVPCGLPLVTESDQVIDLELAQSLGFNQLDPNSSPDFATAAVKRRIAEASQSLAENLAHLAEQLLWNTSEQAAHDLLSAIELFKLDSQRLGSMDLPRNDSLVLWEVRRKYVLECIQSIEKNLRKVGLALFEALSFEIVRKPTLMTDAGRRRLKFNLIANGISPARADEAVSALLNYLMTQNLAPSQLLAAELNRIHQDLMPATLVTLVDLVNDSSLMNGAPQDKGITLKKASSLAKTLRSLSVVAPLAIVVFMALPGCGLKTAPQSAVNELRPDIPFRYFESSKSVDAQTNGKETQVAPRDQAGEGVNGQLAKQRN